MPKSVLMGSIDLDIVKSNQEITYRGPNKSGGTNCFRECRTRTGKIVKFWGTKDDTAEKMNNINQIGRTKALIKVKADCHYPDEPGPAIWVPESAALQFLE